MRQNIKIKAYLRALVDWEPNHWTKQIPIVKFTYNNAKNANLIISDLNPTISTIPEFYLKMTLTPAQDLALLTN